MANLSGKLIKGFSVMCQNCDTVEVIHMNGASITKAEAALGLRAKGWSQTKIGWMCSTCKMDRKVVR